MFGGAFLTPMSQSQDLQGSVDGSAIKAAFAKNKTFQMLMKAKGGSKLKKAASDLQAEANTKADFTLLARSTKQGLGERVEDRILDGVEMAVRGGANEFQRDVGVRGGSKDMSGILRATNIDNVIGNLFEASVLRAGAPFDEADRDAANAPFDFPGGMGGRSKSFQNADALSSRDTDAKTRYTSGNINSFLKKVRDKKTANLTKNLDSIVSELTPDDIESGFATRGPKKSVEEGLAAKSALKKKKVAMSKKAYGGKIDSVPALLTPGEYVINKSSAQSIGYGNLNKMNQTGVKRFAVGGRVGFANGGPVSGGGGSVDTSAIKAAVANAAADLETGAVKAVIAEALVNYSSDIVKPVIDEAVVNYSSDAVKAVIAEAVVNYSSDIVKAVIAEAAVNYSSDAVKAVIAEAAVNYSSDAVKAVIAEAAINYSSDAVKPVIAEALINYSSDAVKAVIAEASINMSTDSVKAVIDEAAVNMSTDSVKAVIDEAAVNMSTDSVKAVIDEAAINMSTDSVKAVIDEAATNFNTDEIKAKVGEAAASLDGLSEKLESVPAPTAAPEAPEAPPAPPAPTVPPEAAARKGPTGVGQGLKTTGADTDITMNLDAVGDALNRIGLEGEKYTQGLYDAQKALESGQSEAVAFETAFDNMKDGIDSAKKAAEQQAASEAAAKKKGGAGDLVVSDAQEFGGSVGGGAAVGGLVEGAKEDSGLRDELKRIQKAEIAAIQKKIRATNKLVTGTGASVSAQDAMTRATDVVREKYGVLGTELEENAKAQKKAKKAAKVSAKAKRSGKIAKGVGKIGEKAQKMEGAAQAAQQFGMMAAMVGGTIIQMSGLSDATKQATTETLGFAAGIMGVGGTVIQMLGSLAQVGQLESVSSLMSSTADTTEAGGSGVAAGADLVEAGASMAAAGPLLILVAVVGAVVLALKFFASKAKAEADALAKGRSENLDKIASGKGGSAEAAKDSVSQELDLREAASGFNNAAYAAAGTAASVALLGATIGSGVPILGTFIGAVVGAGIGYVMSTRELTAEQKAAAAAQKLLVDGIHSSIDSFARLAESSNKFDTAMSDLDQVKLPDTEEGKQERIKRELAITADLDTTGVNDEFDKISRNCQKGWHQHGQPD